MKLFGKHIFTLVLPLTIILFGTITKWRYVYVEDGPDDFLLGFPLAFICRGWHTSMSLQIFVVEIIFNFLVYFIICWAIVVLIDRYIKPIVVKKYLKFTLYGFAALVLLFYVFVFLNKDNVFKIKRDFKYKEIRNGIKFIWQPDKR